MAAFHPFPRLPAELRLQIWHLAAQPRLLVIGKASADATDFTSPTRPPPLTQACREARTSGPYEKAFFSSGSPPRYAWANFDLDTIHLRRFDLVVDFDLALWAGFIGDTYFGPRCPRANVRVICAPTGEWIGESTSRWYGDWYSLHVADFEPARRLEPGEDDYYRSEASWLEEAMHAVEIDGSMA
ncbi:hypothetical protein HYQ46_008804 [Verticillium longisporum]|nr:hypothetical protein HYQ46_008804 [Verticillium longisporum]